MNADDSSFPNKELTVDAFPFIPRHSWVLGYTGATTRCRS
jgi:hypothetical protein